METTTLPPALERIAQRAETGAAELARALFVLCYELTNDLVNEVNSSAPARTHIDVNPPVDSSLDHRHFLSVADAADYLRVKPGTIYSWVNQGKITCSKVGSRVLFERQALIEFTKPRKSNR
jgi:excisionase family DNA binding protein